MKPIEALLERVNWKAAEGEYLAADNPNNLPYVTHSGVLEIAGVNLRCYRLSNGQAIFDADDFENFLGKFDPLPQKE